ncbi:MAG: tyrosine-type recombinase/integrase [bacterium]|nr:tyrosine-type recombinase/integrase [bacterium]
MNATQCIARFVQQFFRQYLTAQRGLSHNTILSYRDTLKLLLQFVARQTAKPPDKLTLEDFDANLVLAFLDHLEQTRGNCSQTRNNRLAGLRTFFRYVAGQEPTVMERCKRICDIPLKRTQHTTIEYLENEEVCAILESVDPNSPNGLRDYALLLFLYNTGARVQEAVDLERTDLRLEPPFQVKLTGKGRKERLCPLWPETVSALETYFRHRDAQASSMPSVFVNARGEPITRFGIRYIVRQYAAKAGKTCPSLKSKKVTPHSVRHNPESLIMPSGLSATS